MIRPLANDYVKIVGNFEYHSVKSYALCWIITCTGDFPMFFSNARNK